MSARATRANVRAFTLRFSQFEERFLREAQKQAAPWSTMPADILARVFASLGFSVVLQVMATSKMWRDIMCAYTDDLTIPARLACARRVSKTGPWPSLQTLRFGIRAHNFIAIHTASITLPLAKKFATNYAAVTSLDLGESRILPLVFSCILQRLPQLTALCIDHISFAGTPVELMDSLAANGQRLRRLDIGEQADGFLWVQGNSRRPANYITPLAALSHA